MTILELVLLNILMPTEIELLLADLVAVLFLRQLSFQNEEIPCLQTVELSGGANF